MDTARYGCQTAMLSPMIESNEQMASLMIIFNLGYLAVFGVFVLLYWHAYRRRKRSN